MDEDHKIKILLVDDHPFVREGVRSALTPYRHLEIVGEATNGQEALAKAAELSPSVIVMDITMPIMNGLEAARRLRKSAPHSKVLFLTLHRDPEFSTLIVEAGARGYVSKNAPPMDLVRAIETVHTGETAFSASMTDAILKDCLLNAGKPAGAKESQLSFREREVLTLIAEGFSNKEVASQLDVSVRTIEKHRERIMAKLKFHSVVELTKYAIANQMVQVHSVS